MTTRDSTCSIGELAGKPLTWDPRSRTNSEPFFYIDIGSIDQAEKLINGAEKISPYEAPSRARQLVKSGDVLVSTVRPNLNAVAYVPKRLDGATASTGFAVLRPREDKLDGRYLYFWVQQRPFIDFLVKRATGANYPAVSDGTVREAPIPLVSIDEQRRIAAILDKADTIRRKRRRVLAEIDALLRAAYLHTLGHLDPEHVKWPRRTIEELACRNTGSMRTGPFGSDLRHSEFVDEGIAVLSIDNAVNNTFEWSERRYITHEKYEKLRRYRVFPNDVIITIMGTTGRSAVIPEDIPEAITTKHLATITPDRSQILPEVLSFAIHSDPTVVHQIERANKGAIMSGLNLGIIKSLQLQCPPLELQRKFARLSNIVREVRRELTDPRFSGEALFASLAQRAFRGGL